MDTNDDVQEYRAIVDDWKKIDCLVVRTLKKDAFVDRASNLIFQYDSFLIKYPNSQYASDVKAKKKRIQERKKFIAQEAIPKGVPPEFHACVIAIEPDEKGLQNFIDFLEEEEK